MSRGKYKPKTYPEIVPDLVTTRELHKQRKKLLAAKAKTSDAECALRYVLMWKEGPAAKRAAEMKLKRVALTEFYVRETYTEYLTAEQVRQGWGATVHGDWVKLNPAQRKENAELYEK